MPFIGLNVEGRHLRIGDPYCLGIAVLIQFAAHRQANLVVVAAMSSTTASYGSVAETGGSNRTIVSTKFCAISITPCASVSVTAACEPTA